MRDGFEPSEGPAHEKGWTKVAIFLDAAGEPAHIARQSSEGGWSSKLGQLEDIWHQTLDCLEIPDYGSASVFMKRQSSEPPA